MSTEGTPREPLAHLPIRRETVGQIRFDPSEPFRERLEDLYTPAIHEMARRSITLSSVYRMRAELAPGGVIAGEEGQRAESITRALKPGKDRPNYLSAYMQQATRVLNGREYFALQFAIQLDPQIAAAIDRDETLAGELLLPRRDRTVKATVVYDTAHILEGRRRDIAVRAIGKFVTGYEIMPVDGSNDARKSPNPQAYTTNLRFTFSSPHRFIY